MGHRNIIHIRGNIHQTTNNRLIGFKKAIKEKEPNDIKYLVAGKAKHYEDGYEVIKKLIKEKQFGNIPVGIFASNDYVAIGAIEAFFESGFNVPEDISIVGYDDLNLAKYARVPLTSVHQSRKQMGNLAATQLLDKISRKEKGVGRHLLMRPYLVERKSCRVRQIKLNY